jgi:hypothetical protein
MACIPWYPLAAKSATNRPQGMAGGSALKVCLRRSSDAPVSTGKIVGLPRKSCSRREPGLLTLSDGRLARPRQRPRSFSRRSADGKVAPRRDLVAWISQWTQ